MGTGRTVSAALLLTVEAGLAAAGVLIHYRFTAEYGPITESTLKELWLALLAGPGALALVLAGLAGLTAVRVSARRWTVLTALTIPALMIVAMLAVTPAALREKLNVQYDATPQCVSGDMDSGPGARAAQESQDAFDSIDHVGHFGRGGSTGVGGCTRSFILTDKVDVLEHYRRALPRAGWRVTEDEADHLRAERDGMAFEVVTCGQGGTVWAGRIGDPHGATCKSPEIAG